MKFAVETWAPDYGTSNPDAALTVSDAQVDLWVELPPDQWRPLDPSPTVQLPQSVLFVDGVERVDARVWVTPGRGPDSSGGPNGDDRNGGSVPPTLAQLGVCASWAAGAVRCDDQATVVAAEVRRGVICAAQHLEPIETRHACYEPRPVKDEATAPVGTDPIRQEIGRARGDLEARVAVEAALNGDDDLVVVDGPLGDRRHIPGAVGYIKTHEVIYLPPAQHQVLARLQAAQRTPLFRIGDRRFRYSWYVRLPGPGPGMARPHATWGIVRCEAEGELPLADAVARADSVTATLPRFASRPHQDARAPQNLHPIAGLERQLRRRLGDMLLLERALRVAAHGTN